MYQVSQKYKEAIARPGQEYKLRGQVGDIQITDADILAGSLTITNQASASTDVNLGGIFIGQLEVTFLPGRVSIPRGSWTDKVIKIEIGLRLDTGEYEFIPIQPFTVVEANHSANGVEVKAVDYMAKFDKAATFNTTSGTPEQLLKYLCGRVSVTLGMTSAEIQALPNGSELLGIDPEMEGNLKTYRDILGWLAQALGSFATINRSGALELRGFTGPRISAIRDRISIGADVRYLGGTYSDFNTRYTGLSVVDHASGTTKYYSMTPDNGLTMNLGSNPFLQLGLDSEVKRIRENVLREVNRIQFTPFDIDTVPNPALDLGDLLTFPDGLGAGVYGCVMATELKYKEGLTIEGFGKNPALADAQSKEEKNISGIQATQDANMMRWFQYVNVDDITLNQYEQVVAKIRFGNSKETDIDVWSEFKIEASNITDRQRVYAYYYVDNEPQFYHPIDTWSEDGFHILGLHYHVRKLPADSLHLFEVRLKIEGGNATILAGDANVVIAGVGIAGSEEWDGIIEAQDEFKANLYPSLRSARFESTAEVNLLAPINPGFEEVATFHVRSKFGVRFKEKVDVIGLLDVYELVTEDDDTRITTEDRESLIVTEYLKDFIKPASEE